MAADGALNASRLADLAAACGVEPGYHDVWGHWHAASEASLRAILAAMGIELGDDASIEAAIHRRELHHWSRVVAPATVVRRAALHGGMRVHLPQEALSRALAWRITEESGELREERFDAFRLQVLGEFQRDEVDVRACVLPLPEDLPEGYHRIAISVGGSRIGEGALIVVPERCYLPPIVEQGGKLWGPALQVYALRSRRDWGIGDFSDLREAAAMWGARGATVVGTNPLHALHLGDPEHASPYSPSSRLFLNVLYIDVEAVEDWKGLGSDPTVPAARQAPEVVGSDPGLIDYSSVTRKKLAALERCFEAFRKEHLGKGTARWRALAQFREAKGPALRRHALHEALREFHGKPWQQWPDEHRNPRSEAVRAFAAEHAERIAFHEYLQWQADRQLAAAQAACREMGMAVGLYADLAISVDRSGSEAWANQGLYALGVSVGAPPDEINLQGQDWGLPPLAPERMREAAYGPLVATLRANMSRAGALRIDHVMGLQRLFWVPAGMPASQGVYVKYPADDLLGILALESHRQRCLVIGEDLGTVSDELRWKLSQAEVLSYRLTLFEREGQRFKSPAEYPRRALTAWSTHDLPTFAGWWNGDGDREALLAALRAEGLEEDIGLAVQAFAAMTPCAVMLVQMEDVLGSREQVNVPGTVHEHPNWRRRYELPVEAWAEDQRFTRMTKRLASIRGGRHRKREHPPGLAKAVIPRATYRLQLHAGFTFRDATALVPYLAKLGVSHVYCSPYLRARPGSKHGYDIIDHNTLNPEIGTREDFDAFVAELHRHDLRQVMDVVPNHMGVMGADNAWWMDVLENGPASHYADFFDIDWHPPSEHMANKVLLPILGDHYGVELSAGHVALRFEESQGSFAVWYFEHRLPLDPRTYPMVLQSAVTALGEEAQTLRAVCEAFSRLPAKTERGDARMEARQQQAAQAKGRLAIAARNPAMARAIREALDAVNGRPEDPASFDRLHELLEAQAFRLAYWRVAADEINYRRFFDINDLAALRMEDERVFEATHGLIRRLVDEGAVDGLRVDHPDGLYDPRAYFRRLQERCERPPYVVVEKIVAPYENLPEEWAVHGTTGYRFANVVNGLFVDTAAEQRITRVYEQFTGHTETFDVIAQRARWQILRSALASELTMLTSRLAKIARASRNTRDFTFNTLRDGLAEVISNFPVYRTYLDEELSAQDRKFLEWALGKARASSRGSDVSVFDFIRDALMSELPARSPALASAVKTFARKFQQVSSPAMAKGVEDTAFYRYVRLLSLNDVGGDPSEFGFPVARFHRASAHRARHWPHTMLATSTHDNKRSEDVRARINVISERAAGWRLQLGKWHRMNVGRKREVDGMLAPSKNDEYILYQTLLGAWPIEADRVVAYMVKAAREAKVHTSWANENAAYEEALEAFVRGILDDGGPNPFLADFREALKPIAWFGYLNSLGVVTVKMTSPGVPDCYQGNETWDFSLVDPDNRRPVDYARRQKILDNLANPFANLEDGRAKLFVLSRLLQIRKEHEALFRDGSYSPVHVRGERARHVVAFARRHEGQVMVTVVPRLTASLGIEAGELPVGGVWQGMRIELPFVEDGTTLTNVLSGESHVVRDGALDVAALLATMPVAVLK